MVTAVINVGLSSFEGSKYEPALEAMLVQLRKAKTLEWLARLGCDFYVEDRAHPVLDAGHEPTIVAILFDVRLTTLTEEIVTSLCDDIGQWCIAVAFTSSWLNRNHVFGKLMGPGKARYEPFDAMKFINPIRSFK